MFRRTKRNADGKPSSTLLTAVPIDVELIACVCLEQDRLPAVRRDREMDLDKSVLNEFQKNVEFIDVMFRMSCASTRMAFGAALDSLPLERGGEVNREGRKRLRAAILSQIKEFEMLLELVGE